MRGRDPLDDQWETAPVRASAGARPRGARIDTRRITPGRVALVVALVGSVLYLAYAILVVRDTSAIPMLSSGAFVLGIAFLAAGIAGAVAMNRASRDQRDRDAMLLALGGGVAVLIGLLCFAGGIVLALVLQA